MPRALFGVNKLRNATQKTQKLMLDGTYAIYERTTEKGNETEQAVNQVTITGESADERKATFSFYASANKNPDESALKGKTFNSVKFDKVYIISFQQISIGAGE